jgi:hypothetical protein
MNCEEARQNAAAYALGALTEAEQAEFERHIAECGEEHDISPFIEAAGRLAESAPEIEPPAGLRERILAAAEAEKDDKAAAAAHGAAPGGLHGPGWTPATAASAGRPAARRLRLGAPVYALAASIIVVLAALLAWNVALQMRNDGPVQLRHFYSEGDGDWLRVEAGLGEPGMTLAVGGLDHLEAAGIYQFWAIRGDEWLHVGDFNTSPEGRWAGDFDFALEAGDSIAITIGPAPDDGWPTTDPEIQTRI